MSGCISSESCWKEIVLRTNVSVENIDDAKLAIDKLVQVNKNIDPDSIQITFEEIGRFGGNYMIIFKQNTSKENFILLDSDGNFFYSFCGA